MSGSYDEKQKVFSLAMFSYMGTDLNGSTESNRTTITERITGTLNEGDIKSLIGDWEVVWGPCIFQPDDTGSVIANLMYVAKNKQPGGQDPQYVVAIAGTYPKSGYAWTEDFDAGAQVDWPTENPRSSVNAKIAKGTNKGFDALQNMKSTSAGLSLADFLKKEFEGISNSGVKITVTGHSLGGALTPVAASWLRNVQSSWDPKGLSDLTFCSFAAPAMGNTEFADYITNSQFSGTGDRVWNKLDIAPRLYNENDIEKMPNLYRPPIRPNLAIRALARFMKSIANGNDYSHVQPNAIPLPGRFNRKIFSGEDNLEQYAKQAQYQHIEGYFALLDTMVIWDKKIKQYFSSGDSAENMTALNSRLSSFM